MFHHLMIDSRVTANKVSVDLVTADVLNLRVAARNVM